MSEQQGSRHAGAHTPRPGLAGQTPAGPPAIGKRTLTESVRKPAGAPRNEEREEKARPSLPDGVDYEALGGGGPSLRVRRRWLESDPAWRPGGASVAPARARELLEHLRAIGVIGWATPEAIERAAQHTKITADGPGDVVRLHWSAALYGHIGLPPGAPAAVTIAGASAVVTVSAPDVDVEPETRVPLGAVHLRAVLRALEDRTGLVPLPSLRQALDRPGGVAFTAVGGHGVFTLTLDRRLLESMYGEPEVVAWIEARRSVESRDDATRTTVVGAGRVRDHGLAPDEVARLQAWLARHLAGPAAQGEAFLDRTVLKAIDRVEAHPHKGRVLAALARLRAGGRGAAAAVTPWELDALLQQALIEGEQAALEIEQKPWRPLAPTFAVPLPARIDQRAGRVVSGEKVPFTVAVDFPPALLDAQQDHDFRYRAFTTDVEWIFEKVGDGSRSKPDHRHDQFQGNANTTTYQFQLAEGEDRATWEVRAHVRHTHFLPAYLTTLVEVKSEPARMAELRDEAFRDLGPVQRRANDFRTGLYNEALGDAKYDQGQRLEGALPASFQARTARQRAAQRAEERARLQQLIAYLDQRAEHGAARRAAGWHLERLQEADRAIAGDEAAGLVSFEVRGTFLSRQPGVEDGPLDLYGAAHRYERKRTRGGNNVDREEVREMVVEVQLRDLSRRFESDAYKFEAVAGSFDAALEGAFVKLCKAYPPGRVALLAQELDRDGGAPTGKTLGFELDTGTEGKDTRATVFKPIVKTVATIAGVAAMIFVPAMAPPVTALLAGYGAIESIDELVSASDKGTLTATKALMNLGSIALDLLPLIGRATPLARSRAGLFVLEGLDRGAQVAYMTAAAHQSIREQQELQLLGIARAFEELIELERSSHPSDPLLAAKRAQIDARAAQVRGAVYGVLDELIKEHALVFGASRAFHAAQHAMMTRDLTRLADLGAYEHVAGAAPRYDRERCVIVADPRAFDGPTLRRLEAERGAHLRELAGRVARALDVAPEHVEIVLGKDIDLAMNDGRVTLTYPPGMSPDGALARWQMRVTEARRAAYRGDADGGGAATDGGGATRPREDGRLPGRGDEPAAPRTEPAPAPAPAPADRDRIFETRAEMVPGSTFRGRTGEDRGAAVLGEARGALMEIVRGSGGATIEAVDAARYDRAEDRARAEQTFVITLPRRGSEPAEQFTIRIATGPLEGQTVARTVVNPTQQGFSPTAATPASKVGHEIRGRYVIQLSDELAAVHVKRAIAHEYAEILALRELAAGDQHVGPDALRPGAAGATLSPHDRGRLAEIEVLAGQLADPAAPATAKAHARDELEALVEHLGLRQGEPGAAARSDLAAAHLGERARAELGRARGAPAAGTAAAAELTALRGRARRDLEQEAERAGKRKIDHDMPRTTDEHGRPLDREALRVRAQEAAAARQQKSDATWARLEELHRTGAGRGEPPLLPFELQIGGGASLAARDRGHLLIDDRGRWQADGNHEIAQTATQTKQTRDAGLGDPTEVVGPNARLPRDAVAHWEDSIAAQGPVVNGRANLRLGDRGELLVDILYRGKTLTFRTDKPPYVSTGFVPERVPGMPFHLRPTDAAAKVAKVLEKAITDARQSPKVQAAAARAHAALAATPMVSHQDATQLSTILGDPDLRAALGAVPAFSDALRLGDAATNWRDLVAADDPAHPHVFFGDHANLGREQARRSHNWVIAGTGGTGVSAAELILSENKKAKVTMVGDDRPAGLFENDQFRKLAELNADPALAARLGVAPGDGRLRMEVDRVGAPTARDGTRPEGAPDGWVDESDIARHLRSRRIYDANGSNVHPQGTAYVAALGRANDYPPIVASLIDQTRRTGGDYYVKPLFYDRQYVGYQVSFVDKDGSLKGSVDVTGAASRYLPIEDAKAHAASDLDKQQLEKVKAAADWDAPAESGNFAGGFAATATQTARYAAARKNGYEDGDLP